MIHVFSSLCILCEELRYAGPWIDVELFGELQEVLHGDALVRHLFHGGELLLHGEVDALDDEVVGGLLAGQHRPLLQERFAVVVLSQPAKLLEVRLVFPARGGEMLYPYYTTHSYSDCIKLHLILGFPAFNSGVECQKYNL